MSVAGFVVVTLDLASTAPARRRRRRRLRRRLPKHQEEAVVGLCGGGLRIAQVAARGTECVVTYLTDALLALGHHATFFASADSRTPSGSDAVLDEVFSRAHEFDIVHFHCAFPAKPIVAFRARRMALDYLAIYRRLVGEIRI
jgi:hypothetical protein